MLKSKVVAGLKAKFYYLGFYTRSTY